MKKILVVGASGGIGNKTAELLLSKGFFVIGTFYKHPENIDNLTSNPNYNGQYVNLSQLDSVKKLAEELSEDELFAVVNCAGIVDFEGNETDKNFEIWNRTIAINLTGNYYLAQLFHDRISDNGRFVMISSTDSYYGGTITTAYAASKAGINSLTKSFSLQFADKQIRVNSIAPGWVSTPMTMQNGEDFLQKVADINPLKRIAQPLDIASVIEFLLSENSDYINGQVIAMEGGYTNQDPTLLIEEESK